MKKLTKIIVLLLVLFAGCEEDDLMIDDEAVMDFGSGIDIAMPEAPDILFVGDPEILLEWNDDNGMFNVVYDANNCTEAAKTFFDCMLPYLNEHIEEKAKLMLKELNAGNN